MIRVLASEFKLAFPETGIYWRVHYGPEPFDQAHAWSRPWGSDESPVRGYSSMASAFELVRYFNARNGIADEAPVVIFAGVEHDQGPDGEPLVVPTRVIAWITGADLDLGVLEYEDDPTALARLLSRTGTRRRHKVRG